MNKSFKRPLIDDIFTKFGFLELFKESEYESLAKQWLKKIKPDTEISHQIVKYMNESQAFTIFILT